MCMPIRGSVLVPGRVSDPGPRGACAASMARARLASLAGRLGYHALELLSPTRCAACERPGALVCDECLDALALIDPALCCSRCAAPFGSLLCTECDADQADGAPASSAAASPGAAAPGAASPAAAIASPPSTASAPALEPASRDPSPLGRCLACAAFEGPAPRIVRAYKDAGEQRLSAVIAEMMYDAALHAEDEAPGRYGGLISEAGAIVFVPATAAAFRRRGFDHMEAIASHLGEVSGVPVLDALVKHGSGDQRRLGRRGRLAQAAGLYQVVADVRGERVLLVDDVVTTGATLRAAAAALGNAGARSVDALAFSRVW